MQFDGGLRGDYIIDLRSIGGKIEKGCHSSTDSIGNDKEAPLQF